MASSVSDKPNLWSHLISFHPNRVMSLYLLSKKRYEHPMRVDPPN